MKNHADVLKTFFVLGLVFVLAGCSNPFITKQAEPDREIPDGKGLVRWSAETQIGRTLFPDLPFDQYELIFTMAGKTDVTETFTTSTGELTLETGRWEVSIYAYIGDDPVAHGSAPLTVLGGQTNTVTVFLKGIDIPGTGITVSGTGTGTLGYDVMLPGDLIYAELSVVSLKNSYSSYTPLTVSSSSGSITLPDGYYVLAFSFFRTTERAIITDVAHLYDGLTTNAIYDFSTAPFAAAPEIAVPSGGAAFYVNNAADLAAIAGDIGNTAKNNGKNAYILGNDIDLSAYGPWTPLGNDTTPFEGYLFGDGHAIRGLKLPNGSGAFVYTGLFGVVNDARIENMGVEIADTHITLPAGYEKATVGIIAGAGLGLEVFKDIKISVASGGEFVVAGGNGNLLSVGGLAGSFNAAERCSFVGNITVSCEANYSYTGGLAGEGMNIRESYMAGTITHTNTRSEALVFTGGLANYGYIENCYHNGNIIASGTTVFTGGITNGEDGVSCSYTAGSIAGSGGAGHTAGIAAGNSYGLNNSAALSLAISGPSPVRIGGSSNRTGNYTLSTMLVNGFVLADAAVDPQDDVNGLGKTAAELKTRSTYETGLGWDFAGVWEMGPANYPYPILQWQKGQVDLPDGYGRIKLPEGFVMTFTDLGDLSDYLASLPQNSALDPYPVKLSGLDISDENIFGAPVSYGIDSLGGLYAALNGKYVNLDLSACTGTSTGNPTVIDTRQNRAMLVSILLPSTLTELGRNAFNGCSSLVSVGIPASVTSIVRSSFQNCSSLVSIDIPAGVTSIGPYAFADCSSLVSINIPSAGADAVIYTSAFQGCSSLVSIDIPFGVTTIGDYAFRYCGSLESVTLPSSVTTIDFGAFMYCTSLKSIVLPSSITTIGNYAFADCSSLASITIPTGVTSIGYTAFMGCAFQSITLPSGITVIDSSTFLDCANLTSIDIPAGITNIYNDAFNGCSSLALVICRATNPPALSSSAFNSTPLQTIQVPAASVDAYKAASGWSGYADKIEAIP
jgi:hypothetical protein